MRCAFLLVCLIVGFSAASAQYTPVNAAWNRSVTPFRIAGNLYYVGVANVSSFLVTTPQGDILIDGGFRETAPKIEASIRELGFHVEDVRILLNTHEHSDHAGGLAALKADTHARLLVNPAAVPLLTSGGHGDFAFRDRILFPPVTPDGVLKDGVAVRLGGMVLTPHFTPGHTRGCTTWTMTVEQGGKPLHVVIACSMSAPGYQLVNNAAYPEIVSDYMTTFAAMRKLPCDIFMTPHEGDRGLAKKARAVARGNPDAFVDPDALRNYIDESEADLRSQIAAQTAHTHPQPATVLTH